MNIGLDLADKTHSPSRQAGVGLRCEVRQSDELYSATLRPEFAIITYQITHGCDFRSCPEGAQHDRVLKTQTS
jgi:hypothetical protein